MSLDSVPKILIIRRDNIGDLVCTTPLIHALRQRFPDGWLGALVNSYNAPVLDGNPDLDELFVYTKAGACPTACCRSHLSTLPISASMKWSAPSLG